MFFNWAKISQHQIISAEILSNTTREFLGQDCSGFHLAQLIVSWIDLIWSVSTKYFEKHLVLIWYQSDSIPINLLAGIPNIIYIVCNRFSPGNKIFEMSKLFVRRNSLLSKSNKCFFQCLKFLSDNNFVWETLCAISHVFTAMTFFCNLSWCLCVKLTNLDFSHFSCHNLCDTAWKHLRSSCSKSIKNWVFYRYVTIGFDNSMNF